MCCVLRFPVHAPACFSTLVCLGSLRVLLRVLPCPPSSLSISCYQAEPSLLLDTPPPPAWCSAGSPPAKNRHRSPRRRPFDSPPRHRRRCPRDQAMSRCFGPCGTRSAEHCSWRRKTKPSNNAHTRATERMSFHPKRTVSTTTSIGAVMRGAEIEGGSTSSMTATTSVKAAHRLVLAQAVALPSFPRSC